MVLAAPGRYQSGVRWSRLVRLCVFDKGLTLVGESVAPRHVGFGRVRDRSAIKERKEPLR